MVMKKNWFFYTDKINLVKLSGKLSENEVIHIKFFSKIKKKSLGIKVYLKVCKHKNETFGRNYILSINI